ncbi:hypothetical protein XA68_10858 [Ophiocordyceps unilateralis]|uniref:Uncharacterized protein n=1 Tax=Ophiocordyceps unilateralis TaxID=268505 RepID=A0A2A9P2F9_OPHUN|nr:hypothetical protein XA68_10858 [Ophiocordyceps unilateralis]
MSKNSSPLSIDTDDKKSANPEKMTCPLAISSSFKKITSGRNPFFASEIVSSNLLRQDATPSSTADFQETSGVEDVEQTERRRNEYRNVPKLDRTMTDIYGDELYSPNFAITSTSPLPNHTPTSPSNDLFSQRINAANSQHLTAAHSPVSTSTRNRSPFRTCSPFASSTSHATWPPVNTSQRTSDQSTLDRETSSIRQSEQCTLVNVDNEPETPKTISPKDAILELNEADEP